MDLQLSAAALHLRLDRDKIILSQFLLVLQTSGPKSATMRFFSNDPDENPHNVGLTGAGTSLADIGVSPAALNFGSIVINATVQLVLTVSNSSLATENLQVSSTSITGGNANQFAILSGGGSFTLTPGTSQNITISFTPTAIGFKDAALQIFSNDADENPKNVGLSGDPARYSGDYSRYHRA